MSAEEYREQAASYLKLLAKASDEGLKSHLLDMACAWQRLAEQAERNSRSDLVYEPPSPRAPTQRPVMQQQQQRQKPGK